MRVIIGILITATVVLATPVQRAPTVVDVPAGIFSDSDVDDAIPLPTSQEKDVELISPALPSFEDTVEVGGSNKKTGTDDLGSRIPTIFVIRRPMISDRFPFFQQSPFFGSSSIFENHRPLFQRPSILQDRDRTPVSDDSDHDMISHMEQMMTRMQQQMSSLWGSFATPSFHRRPLRPIFPSLSFESDEDNNSNDTTINIDNLPPNYSNSTSETKVVDGHVVQVNKTIHKISSGNNTSGFFHFEVINVRPTEGVKTAEPGAPIPDAGATDVKPIVEVREPVEQPSQPPKAEDPSLNEVGETKPIGRDQDLESTYPNFGNRRKSFWATNDEDEASSEVEWIPRTDYQRPRAPTGFRSRARSLSDDLKVNRVVEDQGILSPYLILNPDVELFQV